MDQSVEAILFFLCFQITGDQLSALYQEFISEYPGIDVLENGNENPISLQEQTTTSAIFL